MNQTLYETPYQLKQRKDKQRKLRFQRNLQMKQICKRTLSYNIAKYQSQEQDPQCQAKLEFKDFNNQINVNNSLKKSFYCRKLLNRTVQHHLTYDDYRRVKEKFDQIPRPSADSKEKEHKNIAYSKIWEKQARKYESQGQNSSSDRGLQVVSRKVERTKVEDMLDEYKKTVQKKRIDNIMQIAESRKNQMTFQLQILGNSKTLKVKQPFNSKSPSKQANRAKPNSSQMSSISPTPKIHQKPQQIQQTNTTHQQFKSSLNQQKQSSYQIFLQPTQPKQTKIFNKKYSIFLKQINQRNNALLKLQEQNNNLLKVTRLKQESTPQFLLTLNYKRIKSIKNRVSEAEQRYVDDRYGFDRETKTKQLKRPSINVLREYKPQTSVQRRQRVRIVENPINSNVNMNDIQGWADGQQVENALDSLYQI